MAFPGQRKIQGTKAAGHNWPAAFAVLCFATVCAGNASATLVARTGLSGSTDLRPFTSLKYADAWTFETWNETILLEGRLQSEDGLGDASAKAEWHADTKLSAASVIALDMSYEFERDRDTSIEQYQNISADAGVEHDFGALKAKLDVGLFGRVHENTRQAGFATIDRTEEDFVESDMALRLTKDGAHGLSPFVELAYLRRDYIINTGRSFIGADAIVGVTVETHQLTGDAGLLFAIRNVHARDSVNILGPYVDLKWTPRDDIKIALVLSTGIDQDTDGPSQAFRFHEVEFNAIKAISENLDAAVVIEGSLEQRVGGYEAELTPALKLDWTNGRGFGLFGVAGVTYEKTEKQKPEFAPSLEFGVSWTL